MAARRQTRRTTGSSAARTQKSTDVPTEEEDAAYEAEYLRQVAQGLASTTLLDDAALFEANDPDRTAPVMGRTQGVDRPVAQLITGMPWADLSPVDYAHLSELEFPHSTLAIGELPSLTAAQIRVRTFSARVKVTQRTALSTTDDWMRRCKNAPDGEHRATMDATHSAHVNTYTGSYKPSDQADCEVLIYYCSGEIFLFALLTPAGNIDAWQFYTLGSRDK